MNIIEAIKSGKKYKKENWDGVWVRGIFDGYFVIFYEEEPTACPEYWPITEEDILAEGWEVEE